MVGIVLLADLLELVTSDTFVQCLITGTVIGMLYALIALGYTMVYGIVELINFAHGDLFMLGTFFALTLLTILGFNSAGDPPGTVMAVIAMLLMLTLVPTFTALVNVGIDRSVYRSLRNAPKLAPLVSAIGVSFVLMNIGLFWSALLPDSGRPVAAAADRNFPTLIPATNLLSAESGLRFTYRDLLVVAVTVPIMITLTLLVKYTRMGQAMRATAQNPTAARLMGINVDRVIAATFLIGGALAGFASVVYGLTIGTISYQVGYQNGLYAFTAAVLGGIGNIPGAVLGGLVIGLVRSFGSGYVSEQWTSALVFVILIVILTFRPTGLLGARTREKV
ncbi:branched-chain amino acid ABC transporter permease [Tuwongella immobilis]|uniref:Branched-chain amino acid ABC transporter permease n=1 Tax=Tuwongella immobilis TaxID=692036 RepID=A0A6C2YS84_9BACT|nr:branched-chain amino acid ABC transporter permease [Tuwongella immobilis]VIP03835.1 abc transporter permease : Inner-membrane translocator OS=Pirellula staleyi (strain ATCC 27377 / DSM 6068 / ICPB 4128) GN=Psta_4548 PE=4 SV=1: BPD_transp_2 [Tuwongella immobilis]VTS05037.1 abc transporter permease : Inner-membrane translocator OS=Pirellula staleyi (strain ATCC 27377 / DSM 6068 / ICPB 4128) GN=Psta_4548 PE=4 SV=1: BPD_transp_2 [Tuwongella immobilis]